MKLTDDRGRLVGQYAYTPYGELRAAEYFTPDSGSLASAEAVVAARGNVRGHQGLRTERFDRPWDGALDAATATAAYGGDSYRALNHNRNRTYDPAAGRFIEQDPNGLGGMLLENMAFGGVAITAIDVSPDAARHYVGGMNTHTAYGTSPRRTRDAAGLIFGPVGYALSGGGRIGALAYDIVNTYADNLSFDTDWANDWTLPDNWHTRTNNAWLGEIIRRAAESWIQDSIDPFSDIENLWAMGVDLLSGGDDESAGAGPAMASGGSGAASTVIRTIRVGGRLARGLAHLHHLLPKYLGRVLKSQSKVLLQLPAKFHQPYHNFVSVKMKNMLDCPHMTAPRGQWLEWAKKNPGKVKKLVPTLKKLTKQFSEENKITEFSEALEQALKESFDLE